MSQIHVRVMMRKSPAKSSISLESMPTVVKRIVVEASVEPEADTGIEASFNAIGEENDDDMVEMKGLLSRRRGMSR